MTLGEIWAVMWAKTRATDPREDVLEEMYQELIAAKEAEKQ